MEWSDDEKNINEFEKCFTYEPGNTDECCGASGRKLRRVCITCPNYDRWYRRTKNEKEEKKQ